MVQRERRRWGDISDIRKKCTGGGDGSVKVHGGGDGSVKVRKIDTLSLGD